MAVQTLFPSVLQCLDPICKKMSSVENMTWSCDFFSLWTFQPMLIYIYIYLYISYMCVYACVCACVCVYVYGYIYIYSYIYVLSLKQTYNEWHRAWLKSMSGNHTYNDLHYIYECRHTRACACTHTHTHTHTHTVSGTQKKKKRKKKKGKGIKKRKKKTNNLLQSKRLVCTLHK